ncbi:MAG TPA: hypothetical protein VGY91_08745 [Chthoniobacterales bacterium]|nr:hypothetical protein [Chthoniobacterales bacterium]
MVSYLPVGSEKATEWYAEQVLEAGCAFVNCIPVFIASDKDWRRRFERRGLPLIGDDVKSQVPDGEICCCLNFTQLQRPVMDAPMVPIQWKPVYSNSINMIQNALIFHVENEIRIDWRNSGQYFEDAGVFRRNRLTREFNQIAEQVPLWIDFKVPMGLVVWFIPDHYRLDHVAVSVQLL